MKKAMKVYQRSRVGRWAIGIPLAIILTACASAPTVYQPVDKAGIGYEDLKIESNRFRVQFNGGLDASRLEVEKLALKRAAELTHDQGGEWFRVVLKDVWTDGERHHSNRTGVGIGASGGSRGGVGVGVGVSVDLTPDRKRYIALIEILVGKGLNPADQTDVYDANSILETYNSAP